MQKVDTYLSLSIKSVSTIKTQHVRYTFDFFLFLFRSLVEFIELDE